ncbi:DUF4230 domain-containing protein [Kriegella aquimaris]|uniref:DUF4230 domain-containing protein n=1 Tax=Kriegella aquimaris TaxID=192904 RepID=A0A1G9U1H0_9FLAO|nr:DUF4230 domain-containing protein [Kriegella aquimaris]SDM53701.1 Protein of unknown function [Kriegella aquimaris]
MDSIPLLIIGLILGAALMYWLFSRFRIKQNIERTNQQSIILLEKIRSVCKLISVEGDFAEIYTYENTKNDFTNLFRSKKKALLVINAKVHIGYDFKKVKVHADKEKRKIILAYMPRPEVLSIEPEIQYYDIKSGMFNFFSSEDITTLNKEGKQHILNKIPQSGLMETARKDAWQAVMMIEKIVETIGWKLDYTALELSEERQKLLEENS